MGGRLGPRRALKEPRTRKRRTLTYAGLKKRADRVFSDWIRCSAASGPMECATCITCGAVHKWTLLQCGHFISRVHLSTRYDERNCAPQCYACNVLRRGTPGEFALYLQRRYGPNIIAELVEKKRISVKLGRGDLESLIETYQEKLDQLGSSKER